MDPWSFGYITAQLSSILARLTSILTRLDTVLAQEKTMAIDLTALSTQDAAILAAVSALTPLIQTAITDIQNIPASTDPATQAAIDAHVANLQNNVLAPLQALTASLSSAEAPPPPPAPAPAPTA